MASQQHLYSLFRKKSIQMQRITIGILTEDPEVQGVVKPESGSWQLIVDKGDITPLDPHKGGKRL